MWTDANVTICSPLRDAGQILPAYRERIKRLVWPPHQLRIIAVEGDSNDDTWDQLQAWAAQDERVTLGKCDLGKPHYGSIVHPERFQVLATVFNAALNLVDLEWSDYVLFLPGDIEYQPELLGQLVSEQLDVLAPFSYQSGYFYDIWGFTRDKRMFEKFTELDAFLHYGDRPIAMDTVGGTVLLSKAVLAAGCRYTVEEVDRGLCRQARLLGFEIYGHPGVQVYHPAVGHG